MAKTATGIAPTSIMGIPTGIGLGTNVDAGSGFSAGANAGIGITGPNASVGAHYQNGDVGLGAGIGLTGPKITATVGRGPGAQTGGQVGALVGSPIPVVGPLVGSLVGSTIGSIGDSFFGSKHAKEHARRQGLIDAYSDAGIIGKDGVVTNPDGSTITISGDGSNTHKWKDSSKATDAGDRDLFQFETDYTNPMDYFGGMGGITLSRLLAGKTSKDVDQAGAAIGNASLGKVGYGADFNQQNFNIVNTNLRARYAAAGINSKADMLALANKAMGEGRLKDADYVTAKQTADIIFDNNYGLASQLLAGSKDGITAAAATPQDSHGTVTGTTEPSKVHAGRALTHEEVMLALKPYQDYMAQHPLKQGSSSGVNWAAGIAALGTGLGIYNRARNGQSGIVNVIKDVAGMFSGSGYDSKWVPPSGADLGDIGNVFTAPSTPEFQLPDVSDISNVSDISSNFEGAGTAVSDLVF